MYAIRSYYDMAQANLDLLDVQIEKLTVHAAQGGMVLTSNVQVGEILQAGMTALTIGNVEKLKVTVYLPRITSYNVCYTKLLRLYLVMLFKKH